MCGSGLQYRIDGAPCLTKTNAWTSWIVSKDAATISTRPSVAHAAQGLVLQHDAETDVTFDGIRPEQGGPTCGAGARNINLQRVVFFELPGPARLDVSYQAPGSERLFIRSDCSRPSTLELCEQVNGDASQFSKRLALQPGRYSIHIAAAGAAPEVDYLRIRAVYDDPADGGGQSHGRRLRTEPKMPSVEPESSVATPTSALLHIGGLCNMSVGPETVLRYDAMRDARLCMRRAATIPYSMCVGAMPGRRTIGLQ